jgi:hypothetical protein
MCLLAGLMLVTFCGTVAARGLACIHHFVGLV